MSYHWHIHHRHMSIRLQRSSQAPHPWPYTPGLLRTHSSHAALRRWNRCSAPHHTLWHRLTLSQLNTHNHDLFTTFLFTYGIRWVRMQNNTTTMSYHRHIHHQRWSIHLHSSNLAPHPGSRRPGLLHMYSFTQHLSIDTGAVLLAVWAGPWSTTLQGRD